MEVAIPSSPAGRARMLGSRKCQMLDPSCKNDHVLSERLLQNNGTKSVYAQLD